MDDLRLGRLARALRHRLGLRQEDLARRAGLSQDSVSRIERGRIEDMTLAKVRALARALDADVAFVIRWRGGELDRLMDEGHATLVTRAVELLELEGWDLRTEVSYSVYGERGSIDVLAWHPASRTLLVIEVKTELTSIEATLRKHDEKVRLAAGIASKRFGWSPQSVGRLLVMPDVSTARRRVQRHDSLLQRAYPLRGRALRRWLRSATPGADRPSSAGGILFLPSTRQRRGITSGLARKRIRCPNEGDTTRGARP